MSLFFITCARGLTPYVIRELAELGIEGKQEGSGVAFEGATQDAYKACLWVRCGSRVLLQLKTGTMRDLDDLYAQLSTFPWSSHMSDNNTFATKVTTQKAPKIHTHFAALRVKDAIVDYFNTLLDSRPNVDTEYPDLRFYVHIHDKTYTLYLDLSGEPLHKRGFRTEQGVAPIKENLAAALLYRSNWPEKAAKHEDFIDPLCGAGTILIEAALMARDIAPGLYRNDFAFMSWRKFRAEEWDVCLAEARERAEKGEARYNGRLYGVERSARMIGITKANADRARVLKNMTFHHKNFQDFEMPEGLTPGLIVTNPPYGERLGDKVELVETYQDLGDWMRQFEGFDAGVITSDTELGRVMGLRARKLNKFFNGALETTYLQFTIAPDYFVDREKADANEVRHNLEQILSGGGEDFRNRLLKNKKHLERWANRQSIECYRLYDADLPEFNVAIDRYGNRLVIYEYAAPKTINPKVAEERFNRVLAIVPMVFDEVREEHIYVKHRRRQTGQDQYEKYDESREFFEVNEGSARVLVNLVDYLDTGLFLDHRSVRQYLFENARNKRFLNLFCYTGVGTVHAANGGARTTTSVDMSRTYLKWAERNMRLNGHQGPKHIFDQSDVFEWLRKHIEKMRRKPLMEQRTDKFDLIFMDPPTFSNSKRMEGVLDIQRDHEHLISEAMRLVDRGGELIFSTNLRQFKMDESLSERFEIIDISKATLPEDFARTPRIRQCFKISHRLQ